MWTSILAFCASPIAAAAAATERAPFWTVKPSAIERISNGEILVSARSTDGHLTVDGGGRVKAPRKFVFGFASDFKNIEHLGVFIDRAKFDPATKQLTLTLSAWGKSAGFKVATRVEDPKIVLEVIDGPLRSLRATLIFRELEPLLTEVGIHADLDYTGSAIGTWFRARAFEGALLRVATRLRQNAEAAFAKDKR